MGLYLSQIDSIDINLFIHSHIIHLIKEEPEEEEEEEEEEPKEQLEEQPEDEPEDKPEELPISFMSWWKAVYGREALPSAVFLKYDTTNLFYHLIERWRDSIITKYLLWIFTVNRLEAAASYKK